MPYADKKKRRKVDRDRERRAKACPPPALAKDRGNFAAFLTHAVDVGELGAGWSTKLAAAMGRSDEYDRYLRRVASGEVKPRADTSYNIGEGLHAYGVTWSCGTLALLAGNHAVETLGILDALSGVHSGYVFARRVADWLGVARICLWMLASNGSQVDADRKQRLRTELSRLTLQMNSPAPPNQTMRSLLHTAWTFYQKKPPLMANSLLGIARLVATNPRAGANARLACNILIAEWLHRVMATTQGDECVFGTQLPPEVRERFHLSGIMNNLGFDGFNGFDFAAPSEMLSP